MILQAKLDRTGFLPSSAYQRPYIRERMHLALSKCVMHYQGTALISLLLGGVPVSPR